VAGAPNPRGRGRRAGGTRRRPRTSAGGGTTIWSAWRPGGLRGRAVPPSATPWSSSTRRATPHRRCRARAWATESTTAINLAGALAQARDARVLLVDADLRRPSVDKLLALGSSDGPGLVNLILDSSLTLERVARPRPPFDLSVIPAGHMPPSPYEILKLPRLGELLEEARRRYDYIVLDAPPLCPVQDCRVIAHWVDGFLLVGRTTRPAGHRGGTERWTAQDARPHLQRDDQPPSSYGYYTYGRARAARLAQRPRPAGPLTAGQMLQRRRGGKR
jgi:hypothetical protein